METRGGEVMCVYLFYCKKRRKREVKRDNSIETITILVHSKSNKTKQIQACIVLYYIQFENTVQYSTHYTSGIRIDGWSDGAIAIEREVR